MDKPISQVLKTTFIIHFIVALVFGLVFIFIPKIATQLYGMDVQDVEIYRLLGAALFGFAVSSWLGYKAASWESVRIVVAMEFVWTAIATVVLLYGLLFAGLPALEWINAIIMAIFAFAFGWFYTRK